MDSPDLSRRGLLVGALGVGAIGLYAGPFRIVRPAPTLPVVNDSMVAMGTRVSFLVRHPDPRHARMAIMQAMSQVMNVHATMTLHDESPLTHLNRNAVLGAIEVPPSLLNVLEAGVRIHRESGGVFDPSVQSTQGQMDDIEIDSENRTVRFHHPDVSIDLNGIAKGYAVDLAVRQLRNAGLEHFIVNAGGDLYAAGHSDAEKSGWKVHLDSNREVHWQLSDRAVATSGNLHGAPQPHLIDPKTGAPTNQYLSSTIIADKVMDADAWSTALFVGEPATMAKRIEDNPAALHAHRALQTG